MKPIGHDRILTFFDQVIAAGNLSHAYCFVGLEGVGKHTVAEAIGRQLLTVSAQQFATHPDVLQISPLVDEKTGKTKKNISIEQLRQARSFLSAKPFVGAYKVAIIDPAEKMSLAAANALLKSLEEPSGQSLMFLITSDPEKLPQTIRSRCQTIFFSPVDTGVIEKALCERSVDAASASRRAAEARGCPGRAIGWAEDADSYQWYLDEAARFQSLFGKPLYEKMQMVEPLFGDKKDHIAARERLSHVLGMWQMWIRDTLIESDKRASVRAGTTAYDQIVEARRLLGKNIHPKLLVEHVLLALD